MASKCLYQDMLLVFIFYIIMQGKNFNASQGLVTEIKSFTH